MKSADAVHRLEQVAGAVAEHVASLAALRESALREGFTRAEAMALVLEWHRALIGAARRGEE